MKLYLIRHGQTEWNIEGKIQGKTDIPLNETGLRQAQLLAEGMKKREICAVYSSPLLRASQTASILAETKSLQVQLIPELREVDFGLWEGRSWTEVDEKFHEDFRNWEENPAVSMPTGGESVESCRLRCREAVERMVSGPDGDRDAAIVAHGGILAHVVDYLLRNQKEREEIIVKNASISVVEYDPASGDGRLLLLNDTAHLGSPLDGRTNKFC